jgi:hypothetical protein
VAHFFGGFADAAGTREWCGDTRVLVWSATLGSLARALEAVAILTPARAATSLILALEGLDPGLPMGGWHLSSVSFSWRGIPPLGISSQTSIS